MDSMNRIKAALLGAAVGDALGVPYEFSSRSELMLDPCTTMRGYGTHNQAPGVWSDDTSMVLATVEALLPRGRDLYRVNDSVEGYIAGLPAKVAKNFVSWMSDAAFTATGKVFDIGNTTACALHEYTLPGNTCWDSGYFVGLDDTHSQGNGSLMRILPVALMYIQGKKRLDKLDYFPAIERVARITHDHPNTTLACQHYTYVLEALTNGQTLESAIRFANTWLPAFVREPAFSRIADLSVLSLPEYQVNSSGYIVDTLEAVYWVFHSTNNLEVQGVVDNTHYARAVLAAVNLGGDTDTIASIVGGMVAYVAGMEAIPEGWLTQIVNKDLLVSTYERYAEYLINYL